MEVDITKIRTLIIFSLIPWLVVTYIKSHPWVHVLQLEGYKSPEYWDWLKKNRRKLFPARHIIECALILAATVTVCFLPAAHPTFYGLIAFWALLQISQLIKRAARTKAKKPMVYTNRIFRLLAGVKVIICLEALFLLVLFFPKPTDVNWFQRDLVTCAGMYFLLQLITFLAPYNVYLANKFVMPLENCIKWRYFREAKQMVRKQTNLKVLAITGSYGKTSTKFFLHGMMSTGFPTLMTPESYNTPMGVTKIIRGELKSYHQFFVVEMGARYTGDIAELCRLTPPIMGILTAIGPHHLDTFGNLETIIKTKGELLKALPPEGVAVINQDDPNIVPLALNLACQCLRYGIGASAEKNVWGQDISCGPEGTGFTLYTKGGENIVLRTQLLGEHNVYNILAAACAAIYWQVPLNNIARSVARLQPVPHRLQLLRGEGGVFIIDDAFNSNPVGAAAALNVLKSFDSGRKILITPGMVELGDTESAQNKQFGNQAASACDYVILVGPKRTVPIAEGLAEANFPSDQIFVVKDLTAARKIMNSLVKSGDVVLFENDLPDHYNE
ncbi:MAG: UDP-N-acetylmuramoyl-tripeptide--D-alanyl-D-alanine ligase [Candidatus Schekmanbacteria bacterium]|nr:UDP-N-acetylmuramoyl-tripeptide--D-alanyl-D-alanine ligase [Candidatus Schekmanbacteria bacterium]